MTGVDPLLEFIAWAARHPLAFFIVLFFQYALLATLQGKLGRHWVLYPLALLFIAQDWLMNMLMTLLFLDLPASPGEVVTKRMQRYKKTYTPRHHLNILEKWRHGFAVQLCKQLNRFDSNHC